MSNIIRRASAQEMANIEQSANQFLSHFGGPDHEFGGPDLEYDGYGDDMVDFEGQASNFGNEVLTGRRFTVTLVNANEANTRADVTLFASHATTIAAIAGVTVTGKPKPIANLRAWIVNNPVRCMGFKVDSTSIAQNSEVAVIRPQSPFRNLEDEIIAFDDFTKTTDFRDKMVEVNVPFQLDNQTDFVFGLPGACTTNITFYFGAALNTAKSLMKKAKAAGGKMSPNHRLI